MFVVEGLPAPFPNCGAHGTTAADAIDAEIQGFYEDNAKLIAILPSLVGGVAYDSADLAGVYGYYASFYWASVRGEKMECHPNYRG